MSKRSRSSRQSTNDPLPPGPVNVLLIGSGGREHALGWRLKKSKRCGRLFFAPGNAGTADLGQNVPLKVEYNRDQPDFDAGPSVTTKSADAIDYFCRQNGIALIVIGGEDPLAHGLADRLQRPERLIFGPVQAAARLEGDKAYAKTLMRAASIPTADSRTFTGFEQAVQYVQNRETPVVVKAAGLAKGKGAIVTSTPEQAVEALRRCMVRREFGDAGLTVVVEERLAGQEVSVLALVDGRNLYVLDPCQDHKPVGEGDTGPNTGGMGAYCPTPVMTPAIMQLVQRQVLVPIVDALRREGTEFRGVLYAGLMLTPGGPKVLEFNTRFGDPETQPLMMRLRGDLLDALIACCSQRGGGLADVDLSWDPRPCVCTVLASGGYPGDYKTGAKITGIDAAEKQGDVRIFHAGTKRDRDGDVVTAGGRVLGVCGLGDDLADARRKANHACGLIAFEGAQYRRDIGSRVM